VQRSVQAAHGDEEEHGQRRGVRVRVRHPPDAETRGDHRLAEQAERLARESQRAHRARGAQHGTRTDAVARLEVARLRFRRVRRQPKRRVLVAARGVARDAGRRRAPRAARAASRGASIFKRCASVLDEPGAPEQARRGGRARGAMVRAAGASGGDARDARASNGGGARRSRRGDRRRERDRHRR
jgi:hypothetical protein